MGASDWEQVRAIYLEGIRSGHSTFETDAPSWEQWNEGHLQIARLVMRDGETILGWAALSPVSKRYVYRGVAELTVYVSENARGQGIGRELLEALIEESEKTVFGPFKLRSFRKIKRASSYICDVDFVKWDGASGSRC